MKKLLFLTGLLLLVSGVAMAQVDPDPNGLGLYYDMGGTVRCQDGIAPGMKSLYLIATDITQPTLGGWECSISCDSPMWMFLSAVLAGTGPINLFTAPDFQVGLGIPMNNAPSLLLATINYFVQDMNPAALYIGPCSHPSTPLDPTPLYADGANVGILVPFQAVQGNWDLPVAFGNAGTCDIIAVENDTWGGVKGLYR